MAKIRTKRVRSIFAPRRDKHLSAKITISRLPGGDWSGLPFLACIRISPSPFVGRKHGECAAAKNPRQALAKALRLTSTVVAKRSGAFKGHRRRHAR